MGAPGNSGSRGLILQESMWPLTTLSPLGGLAPAGGRLRRGAAAGGAAEGVQPCRPRFWVVTCCQPFGILSLANWSSQRLENGHYCNVRAGPGTTGSERKSVCHTTRCRLPDVPPPPQDSPPSARRHPSLQERHGPREQGRGLGHPGGHPPVAGPAPAGLRPSVRTAPPSSEVSRFSQTLVPPA